MDGGSSDTARGADLRDVSPSGIKHLLWIVPLALAVGAVELVGAWYFQKILEHYDLMFWR